MNNYLINGFVYVLVFCVLGMIIGRQKGRVVAGALWSMTLGPFGWLIIALGPNMKSPESYACPHCTNILAENQKECHYCKNSVIWVKGKPQKRLARDGTAWRNQQD